MSGALVGPLPVVRFHGGPRRPLHEWGALPAVAYVPPRDTMDPRYRACTDHHVACDCREAEHAEQVAEHVAEWKRLRDVARVLLAGHQVERPWSTSYESWRFPLCDCTGCRLHRAVGLLRLGDIDMTTGRALPLPPPETDEVPF